MFKRLDRVGCSDGVFKGGFGERLEEGPTIGRSCMLSESRYSGEGHAWNSMSDMQLGSLWGGWYFWKGGSQKGGFGRTPEPSLVTGLPVV